MTDLKQLRIEKHLTQEEAAKLAGISLRSYVSYENDCAKSGSLKYRYLLQEIGKINTIDEEHGILAVDDIRKICSDVFSGYDVDYCYLFGSYSRNEATDSSDVDLLISTRETGLRFYEIAERLRGNLLKRVDLLDLRQLLNNEQLLNEVLKDGIKIYG